jgi:hypothetical protein
MSRRAAVLVALLTGAVQPAIAQDSQPSHEPSGARIEIAVERGVLTAIIRNAPLAAALEELSRRTRVAIVVAEGLEDELVSVDLKNVGVDEGLRALLGNYDTFFYYGLTGQQSSAALAAVWVYRKGEAATLRPAPLESWAVMKDLEIAVRDHDPVVRERAYEALMSRPDRASRNLVILAIRGASESDSDLRERLLSTAVTKGIDIPGDVLKDLVRADGTEAIRLMAFEALAGDPQARDVALAVASDASEVIRERAREFLAELDSAARNREVIKR